MRDFTNFTWTLVALLVVTLFVAGSTMSCGDTDNEAETVIESF